MEGLIARGYVLAGIFAVAGVWSRLHLTAPKPAKTEQWMESNSVKSFGKYKMSDVDASDPLVSYKVDKSTYETLGAYGIVARVLGSGNEAYDVLLLASNAKASFHDPHVCFSAQGWQLNDEENVKISTKTRGQIPLTVSRIHSDYGDRWAAFCYKGPSGFASSTNMLKLQMLEYSLVNSESSDGIFYRFIAQQDSVSRQQLLDFVAKYMDASCKVGNGYF